jgi:hypothetical protein
VERKGKKKEKRKKSDYLLQNKKEPSDLSLYVICTINCLFKAEPKQNNLVGTF